ncbi:MAG: small subunit ribosomal protein [Thermoleophilaceae bacterium]|jgi:small subunit ribosomal protein S4|nr:small subunit ribosomal protein [Thermoleophilaceae bacterium]
MGRYTGPTERLSRRAGVELELKGERRLARKSGLDRRAYPPGVHGGRSGRRPSTYAIQLAAKQAAKRYYGVRERQFRRYVREAQRATGSRTGERLLQLLELRLDNALTRLGFAATRAQARQFVVHGHVEVNGRRCDIPSRRVAAQDVVAIRSASPVRAASELATELTERVAPWLLADTDALVGRVLREPARGEIQAPVEEQLIVEFYSRV